MRLSYFLVVLVSIESTNCLPSKCYFCVSNETMVHLYSGIRYHKDCANGKPPDDFVVTCSEENVLSDDMYKLSGNVVSHACGKGHLRSRTNEEDKWVIKGCLYAREGNSNKFCYKNLTPEEVILEEKCSCTMDKCNGSNKISVVQLGVLITVVWLSQIL